MLRTYLLAPSCILHSNDMTDMHVLVVPNSLRTYQTTAIQDGNETKTKWKSQGRNGAESKGQCRVLGRPWNDESMAPSSGLPLTLEDVWCWCWCCCRY